MLQTPRDPSSVGCADTFSRKGKQSSEGRALAVAIADWNRKSWPTQGRLRGPHSERPPAKSLDDGAIAQNYSLQTNGSVGLELA
jgi:hypothetical protein